jgi:hypothetical protein
MIDKIVDKRIVKRVDKAIVIKKALISVGADKETGTKEFSEILNTWIKDGVHREGFIELPEIKKYIVYKFRDPEKTMVKISTSKKIKFS